MAFADVFDSGSGTASELRLLDQIPHTFINVNGASMCIAMRTPKDMV